MSLENNDLCYISQAINYNAILILYAWRASCFYFPYWPNFIINSIDLTIILLVNFYDNQMSIVSFLWQYQTKGVPIPTTIIKTQQQIPHHYLYSQKQGRVLRKKNPQCILMLQSLNPKSLVLEIGRSSLKKQNNLSINLVDASSCIQNLRRPEFEGQYSVVQNGYQIFRYAEIFKQPNKEVQIENLLFQENQQIKAQRPKIVSFAQSIRGKFLQIWAQGNYMTKKTSNIQKINKVISMELIVGQKQQQVVLIEAIRIDFQIQIQNLFSIKYKPTQARVSQSQIANGPKSQSKQEKALIEQMKGCKIEKSTLAKCACCQSELNTSQLKQVHNEALKGMRRQIGKPIRGLNEEYYQVCPECYIIA